ncbi:GNAT family N-acetyltransferase [Streptomyces sp. NBC_00140]|uniref:GNAT family N-acetyltransferase n=1 Tax=Streptomyces sp. NBC_00140 TaxID=2975664 RepID=UPI00224F7231|nr:GNAT family N-acetyltransferase [Streptomyces sp. NBC_00140]MCX5330890.1 acetyltransferase [Streptomyces sp. NBC_00140]
MPPTDASADAGTAPGTDAVTCTNPGPADRRTAFGAGPGVAGADPLRGIDADRAWGSDSEDTLDLRLPDELLALIANEASDSGEKRRGEHGAAVPGSALRARGDLLGCVADWGSVATPVGVFHLVPVQGEQDLALISRWMNDPTVAEFWQLSGPRNLAADHVHAQLAGDGRSVPCLGVLDGTPMSYWEIYRADLDPLARHYPARPHDTGIHLLVGEVADRGRGLGSALLRAVADLALDKRPACARVIAEPAMRNTPSVSAFLSAGFRFSAEVDLPDKRAALMVRDRCLRDLM